MDVETGNIDFEEWESSDRTTGSSFESTGEMGISPRVFKSRSKSKRSKSKRTKKKHSTRTPEDNEEWHDYIKEESRHLVAKSRKRSRRTSFYSSIFTYLNDLTNMYIIIFALATFIISSIKETYDVTDYILIGLAGIATTLESAQTLFKYKKRSIYFKQASVQYKRIYRKLTKYLYTSSTDRMAEYLSLAYQDFDKLALNDHQANFNKFNKSYAAGLEKLKQEEYP